MRTEEKVNCFSENVRGNGGKQKQIGAPETKSNFFSSNLDSDFFLRRFSGADQFAHFARMFSVEGFGKRDCDGIGLRLAHGHSRPGDHLQKRPMAAQRQTSAATMNHFAERTNIAANVNANSEKTNGNLALTGK